MCQNHKNRRASDRHFGGKLILAALVLGLAVAAAVYGTSVLDSRRAIAACADRDAGYQEFAAALEECASTDGCMITASEIRSLRKMRAAAADRCAAVR